MLARRADRIGDRDLFHREVRILRYRLMIYAREGEGRGREERGRFFLERCYCSTQPYLSYHRCHIAIPVCPGFSHILAWHMYSHNSSFSLQSHHLIYGLLIKSSLLCSSGRHPKLYTRKAMRNHVKRSIWFEQKSLYCALK